MQALLQTVTALALLTTPPGAVTVTHTENFTLITGGNFSGANEGVLPRVAWNRMAGYTEYNLPTDIELDGYTLIAVQDCTLIGRDGWLHSAGGESLPVLVVDCQERGLPEAQTLHALGLMADVNAPEVWGDEGFIILEAGE